MKDDFILIITFSIILDGLIIDEKSSLRWVTYNYVIQYKLKLFSWSFLLENKLCFWREREREKKNANFLIK